VAATTPVLGLKYPQLSDDADIPADMQLLAQSVEDALSVAQSPPNNNLDQIQVQGIYYAPGNATNNPFPADVYAFVEHYVSPGGTVYYQQAHAAGPSVIGTQSYTRRKLGSAAWSTWKRTGDVPDRMSFGGNGAHTWGTTAGSWANLDTPVSGTLTNPTAALDVLVTVSCWITDTSTGTAGTTHGTRVFPLFTFPGSVTQGAPGQGSAELPNFSWGWCPAVQNDAPNSKMEGQASGTFEVTIPSGGNTSVRLQAYRIKDSGNTGTGIIRYAKIDISPIRWA